MKMTSMTAIIAVVAGLSSVGTVAVSQSLGADVSVSDVDVSADVDLGGGDANVDAVDADVGNTASADADVSTGDTTNASVDANMGNTSAASSSGTSQGSSSTSQNGPGANIVTSNSTDVDASLNFDVSGLSNAAPLRNLDVNQDGLVNRNDDVNGDGRVDNEDVQLATTGTTSSGTQTNSDTQPNASGTALQSLASMDPAVLRASLRSIDENDVLVLKQECKTVLGDPQADRNVLAVCRLIAEI